MLGFEDASMAPLRGVRVGDQLVCVDGESVVGAELGDTVGLFGRARRSAGDSCEVELVLFHGKAKDLQDVVSAAAAQAGKEIGPLRLPGADPDTIEGQITVTVSIAAGQGKAAAPPTILRCAPGTNLRDLLLANGINPYRSVARFTNCSGKQLCGTCIVDVAAGVSSCSRKGLDEASTLRQNPDSYRLCCVTDLYGDVSVVVGGPVGAGQWTR